MRQVGLGEDFVAVQAGQRGLGRREHEMHPVVGRVFNLIDLVGEFRELPCRLAAAVFEHQRQHDHLVAVGQMLVDEIVQQRPFQTAAHAAVHPEARASQLRAALIVDQAEVGAEVDVMLRLKVEGMRLAVVAQRLVVLLAAGLQVGVGQVRKAQHQRAILGLDVAERLVVLGDLRLQLGHALEDRRDVLARLFSSSGSL